MCPWRKRRPAPCWFGGRLWCCMQQQSLMMIPGCVSPSRRRPKADPDPWSAGPSTGSCLRIAQNAPSSSCSTSQYPLVRRKNTPFSSYYTKRSPRKARRVQEKPFQVLVQQTKWKIRRIGCSCWCRLQSYLRFETVTSNGLCLTMERKRLGAV